MIFVDSSAWIAVMLKREQHHSRAAKAFESFLSKGTPLVTTDYVLSETYTFIRHRTKDFAKILRFDEIVAEAEKEKFLIVRWTDKKVFQEARRLLLKYSDQMFSFVDCVSFITARELKLKEVFTFDRDFHTMGFQMVPAAG